MVADRGMISKALIEEIDKAGLSYIFGVKMRRSKRVEAVLNQPGDYEEVEENLKVKEALYEGEIRNLFQSISGRKRQNQERRDSEEPYEEINRTPRVLWETEDTEDI